MSGCLCAFPGGGGDLLQWLTIDTWLSLQRTARPRRHAHVSRGSSRRPHLESHARAGRGIPLRSRPPSVRRHPKESTCVELS